MNPNINVLCELLKDHCVKFHIIHECGNLIEIISQEGEAYLFASSTTPFNLHSDVSLCRDKEFFYRYFYGLVSMPETVVLLNPDVYEKYKDSIEYKPDRIIIQESESVFKYPFIVKMNNGSQGKCVFKVHNEAEFKAALGEIYKLNYIALAQEYIYIKDEYRAIFFDKKLIFAYKRSNENAKFVENLSPLHFEGAKTDIVKNKNLLHTMERFILPILNKKNIRYLGIDIALDKNNKMWLIEANSAPGFSYFLKNPEAKVLVRNLYEKMLKALNIPLIKK